MNVMNGRDFFKIVLGLSATFKSKDYVSTKMLIIINFASFNVLKGKLET